MSITESMLIDYGLLNPHGRQWKYRLSVGSGWMSASTKEKAIAGAIEAFLKAGHEELLTRDQRFEKADAEELSASECRWGHLSMTELSEMMIKMGGDISDFRKASSGEFDGNGGRRTPRAVSAECARGTSEIRSKLERYIKNRIEHAVERKGAQS